MKQNHSKPAGPSIFDSWPIITNGGRWVTALVLCLSVVMASAQTNNFGDGYGDDPTPLDQFPSATGAGWNSGWQLVPGSSFIDQTNVISTSPLNGGGNYLNWRSAGANPGAILRPFGGVNSIDITWPYIVEFDYRLDVFTSNNIANFAFFDRNNDYVGFESGFAGSDQSKGSSFWVKSQGAVNGNQPGLAPKFWSFLDGGFTGTQESAGLFVNSTNVPFATNATYHFRFVIDPVNRLYEGSVTNVGTSAGFNTTAATGRKFRWKAVFPSTTDFVTGTNLLFVARQQAANKTNIHSLDNITMTQVPRDLWQVILTQVLPVSVQTFYPASSNFVFSATTTGLTNTIVASNAMLVLNGQAFTTANGLSVSGTDADTNRTVTYSGLQDNKTYDGLMIAGDQAGRMTTNSVSFDTFTTNVVTVIEAENYNFDPAGTACDPVQTDVQADRYIQNWVYGANLGGGNYTNLPSSYYARRGVSGIDYNAPVPTGSGTAWRTCDQFRNRGGTSTDFSRQFLGVSELLIEGHVTTNAWWNYTHEWPSSNYIAYLRVGVGVTNYTFGLSVVTNDYTAIGQLTNLIGNFQANVIDRREDLRNYPLVNGSGFTKVVQLSGKTTLKLAVNSNTPGNANSYLNYMVFVPFAPIVISNVGVTGSDFSFQFNTEPNVRYAIQYKTSVTDVSWSTLTSVTGNGSLATVHDTTGDARIYRVQTQ